MSSRKERISWYLYDWANSAFSTTVVTVFLGPYLATIAENAARLAGPANNYITILGFPIHYDSYFPYVVSLSVVLQVFLLPVMGAIADYTNRKKLFLGIFAYIGAFSTMGLFFLEGTRYLLGGWLFLIANLSFGASIVVYNAYLGEISKPDERDSVSSVGWSIGYLGGGILLAINLALYTQAENLGLSAGYAVRICLTSAGIWWAIFTVFPMIVLKIRRKANIIPPSKSILSIGFSQLWNTIKNARKYPKTLRFLIAYLFYNDGVQAVITLTAVFANKSLGLEMDFLIIIILMVQFIAFFGALLFNFIAKATKAKGAILISLIIWSCVVIYACIFLPAGDKVAFTILSVLIAIVLGGTQALSRSLFSRLIPSGKEAEYFSLYEISERGTSWLGPFIFGFVIQLQNEHFINLMKSIGIDGSYRRAVFSLIIFFIVGFLLLLKVNVKQAEAESNT